MASLKLRLASVWFPESLLKGELERISNLTTNALFSLLREKASDSTEIVFRSLKPLAGSIEERRAAMASNHNVLVESLAEAIGEEETLRLGRDVVFKIGLVIGEEARARLGIGDSVDDLIMAARALYRVLGIRFTVQQHDEGLEMVVSRCALSKWYTARTCMVLSATDEGVIKGLNRRVGMKFDRTITAGFPSCMARILVDEELSGARP